MKQLISPYLPSKNNIKSTEELIQVLHTLRPNNDILVSLDVENLFTNVPVNKTIDIIINNIYNNQSLSLLKINPNILRKLLLTYTTEVPFHDQLGNIYIQTLWDLSWVYSSVISTCPTLKMKYLIALKILQYT